MCIRDRAKALETNKALTTLDLGSNGVGDAGAGALARALETNATLVMLVLSENRVGDAGARALVKGLEKNTTLETLEMSDNRFGVAGHRALDWAQAKRRVLVFLSAPFVRGESAARILVNGDGDHAIATRVLGYLLPSADDHPSDDEDEDDSDSDEDF